jgi:hypothetical protein
MAQSSIDSLESSERCRSWRPWSNGDSMMKDTSDMIAARAAVDRGDDYGPNRLKCKACACAVENPLILRVPMAPPVVTDATGKHTVMHALQNEFLTP